MLAFKVDENLPAEATSLLQDAGIDALSVHDQSMVGTTDDNIAVVCQAEDRALITLDLDFADIRAYPPDESAGLVVLRLERQDKTHVLDVLSRLIPQLNKNDLSGKLWIVTEKSIRIRG
jgi:predicted nuclease of predicted toxin-antitoxin system